LFGTVTAVETIEVDEKISFESKTEEEPEAAEIDTPKQSDESLRNQVYIMI